MHLMVWLKDIYLGGDIEGDVSFTHLTLHYYFSSLLFWCLKYLLLGYQVHSTLQLCILSSLRLGLVLSSNMLKGWTSYPRYWKFCLLPQLLIGKIYRPAELAQECTFHKAVFCHSDLVESTDGEQSFLLLTHPAMIIHSCPYA